MPFKKILESAVSRIKGGVGIIFVDSEGEAIDQFTYGDVEEIRLAGAQQGLILRMCEDAMARSSNGNSMSTVGIRSENYLYTMVPVTDGTFLVLVQDSTGIQTQGMQVLRDTVPEIQSLI